MFRRLRTRRAIKTAEKTSGLKKENSIFRGKKMQPSLLSSSTQQLVAIPNLTTTFSEESDTDGITSTINYSCGETIQHMNDPYDVDVVISNGTNTQDLELHTKSTDANGPDDVVRQMTMIVQELKKDHQEKIMEKDAMIQDLCNELDRTRQEFIDVIVDLNVKEQELSATKQKLILKENELDNVTKDLFDMKDQLNLHGSTLIQYQHKLYEAEEELALRRQRFGLFLHL